jgi:hypothetical protein
MYLMIGSQLQRGAFELGGGERREQGDGPVLVVDLVAIAGGVDNVQAEADVVFDND